MKLKLTRVAALGVSTVLVAGGAAIVGATSASAAVLNTYLGQISTAGTSGPGTAGTINDNFSFTTVYGCPANDGAGTNTRNFRMTMNGPNWSNITIVGNTGAGVNTTGPMAFPIADNFAGLASSNSLPNPSGTYLLTGFCQSSTGSAVSGKFFGQLTFTGNNFTVVPIPEETTTTSLTSPSAGTQAPGTAITVTASVAKTTPPGVATLAGTVQFKKNGSNLGSPQTLSGGTASINDTVAVGSNSYTAVFTADNTSNVIPAAQVLGSQTAAPVVVTGVYPATSTTTAISAPASGFAGNPVTLNAAITLGDTNNGSAATGTVAFFVTPNGGSEAPVAGCATVAVVSNGASCTIAGVNVAAGTFTYRAAYTSSDTSKFASSTSGQSNPPTVIAAIAPTRVATEFIRTTVPPGALTITVQGYVAPSPQTPKTGDNTNPFDNSAIGATPNSTLPYGDANGYANRVTPNLDANGNNVTTGASAGINPGQATSGLATNVVVLPQTVLNPAGTLLVSNGYMIPVVTTDTRAGDLPFNVTGKLLDDFQGLTAANKIDGRNLGWDPIFIKSTRFPSQGLDTLVNGVDTPLTDANGRVVNVKNGSAIAPSNGVIVGEALTGPRAGWSEGLRPTVANNDPQSGNVAYPTGTRTLFSVSKGAGTWWWGAQLSLQAPTTTQPDTYQATLQMTANGTGA